MRYYEDTKYYHFSTNPATDSEERSIILEEHLEYARDFMSSSFRPADNTKDNIIKYSAIAVFVIAVILMVTFSMNGMVGYGVCTFGGLFVLLGILSLVPAKPAMNMDLPGKAQLPKGVAGTIMILLGLVVIVPAVIAPVVGFTKAAVGGGAAAFVLVGLFFVVYTCIGIARHSKASQETVNATCIGYIKMIDGSDSKTSHAHNLVVTGTPVYEYYYNGQTYKAFQEDDIRTGRLSPEVGETVEVGIMPDDPYAIFFRKNTGAKVFAFVMSFLAIAAGIGLFCFLPNVSDKNGFAVNTMGGQVMLAKAEIDDKTIEGYIGTDEFTIEYATVTSVEGNYVYLSNDTKRKVSKDDKDRYHEGTAVYLVLPEDGGSGMLIIADEWEYTGSHEVIGLE